MQHKACLCALLMLCTAPLMAAESKIYKWVDEQGQVHYGDAPKGKQSGVRTGDDNAVTSESPTVTAPDRQQKLIQSLEADRRAREEEKAKKQQQREELERRCYQARDRLRQYESSSHLYDLDAEGKRRVLSDSERKSAEDKLRSDIDKYCK